MKKYPVQPKVRTGQVWADNDPRSAGRLIKVTEVDATHAAVVNCDSRGEPNPSVLRARRGRIALTRFKATSTGYRIYQDVEDPA